MKKMMIIIALILAFASQNSLHSWECPQGYWAERYEFTENGIDFIVFVCVECTPLGDDLKVTLSGFKYEPQGSLTLDEAYNIVSTKVEDNVEDFLELCEIPDCGSGQWRNYYVTNPVCWYKFKDPQYGLVFTACYQQGNVDCQELKRICIDQATNTYVKENVDGPELNATVYCTNPLDSYPDPVQNGERSPCGYLETECYP
jgi:hypothetical protein